MKLDGVRLVPTGEQVIAPLFAQWSDHRPYDGHPPGEIGASALGRCSRALVYQIRSDPKTNPMTESGHHATGIGSAVHGAINQELDDHPPEDWVGGHDLAWEMTIEVPVPEGEEPVEPLIVASEEDIGRWFREGVGDDGVQVEEVVEIKTMALFGFVSKVTREGPDRGHLIQAGMAMKARVERAAREGREVEVRGRLVYILPNELKGSDRIVKEPGTHDWRENRYAEFTFSWEAVSVHVLAEMDRLAKVRSYMDRGITVPRTIDGVTPRGATIVGTVVENHQIKGIWQHWEWVDQADGGKEPVLISNGKAWHCGYCDWRDRCMSELKTETEQADETEATQ